VRQGADGAVQVGAQRVRQHVPQQLPRLLRRADGAAGHLGAQRLDQLHGHLRAEVGLQEHGLDVLPRLLVQLTGTEQAEQTLAETAAGAGEPAAQALQPPLGGGDVGGRGRGRRGGRCRGGSVGGRRRGGRDLDRLHRPWHDGGVRRRSGGRHERGAVGGGRRGERRLGAGRGRPRLRFGRLGPRVSGLRVSGLRVGGLRVGGLRVIGRRAAGEGDPASGLVGATSGRRGTGPALDLFPLAQADLAPAAQQEAERDGDDQDRHHDGDDDPEGLRGHGSTLSRPAVTAAPSTPV
jgi:hypothetical protein